MIAHAVVITNPQACLPQCKPNQAVHCGMQVSLVKSLLSTSTSRLQEREEEQEAVSNNGPADIVVATIDSFQVGTAEVNCQQSWSSRSD
jgi:hypothetical protein